MAGKVRGYASVFGNIDKANEIVDQGAFSDWLAENPGKSMPVLWMHMGYRLPVGSTSLLREDEKGLYYEAPIFDTVFGKDLLKAIAGGAVTEASFAYRILDEYREESVWHLSKLELIEVSPVTKGFAANPMATTELMEIYDDSTPAPAAEPGLAEIFAAELRRFLERL